MTNNREIGVEAQIQTVVLKTRSLIFYYVKKKQKRKRKKQKNTHTEMIILFKLKKVPKKVSGEIPNLMPNNLSKFG